MRTPRSTAWKKWPRRPAPTSWLSPTATLRSARITCDMSQRPSRQSGSARRPTFIVELEALGLGTEFRAGVVVANHLEGMKFTLGPSMAVRRDCLRAIGGFAAMADYLADDFVLGQWASEAGYEVALLSRPINHHATALGFTSSFKQIGRASCRA